MKVTLQYFDSCPGWRTVDTQLQSIVQGRGLDVTIQYQRIETYEEAERYRFAGSPTVLVDGRDPWPDDQLPIGLACRTYVTEDGLTPFPSVAQIERALDATDD